MDFPAFAEMLNWLEVFGLPEGCEVPAELATQFCANEVEMETEPTMESREILEAVSHSPACVSAVTLQW